MLRLICRVLDNTPVLGGADGGETVYTTFDVELPEVETYLRDHMNRPYCTASVVGVEIKEPPLDKAEGK